MKPVWEDESVDIIERIDAWEDTSPSELSPDEWRYVAVDLLRDAHDVIEKLREDSGRGMKLPKPEKCNGEWRYTIDDKTYIVICKTTWYNNPVFTPSNRWTIEMFSTVYACTCLPTRRACIDAIPRLLRALP